MRALRITSVLLVFAFLAATGRMVSAEPLELKDGDRVVFLGNTLIERAQSNDYLETMLTAAWPERKITFRNLGWSGDTVWGEARAGFGTAEDGFKHLVEHVTALKPTVIFVGYGANEVFAGHEGREKFRDGYIRLLDAVAPTGARLILITPLQMENMEAPLSRPSSYNGAVCSYTSDICEIANDRNLETIDLRAVIWERKVDKSPGHITGNGMHLTNNGYWYLARYIALQDLEKESIAGFEASREPDMVNDNFEPLANAPEVEALRQVIMKKNELYFHRWRPQNETYLFGFRKYEQGNNAVEIPQFDPLVEEQEKKIAELRAKLIPQQ